MKMKMKMKNWMMVMLLISGSILLISAQRQVTEGQRGGKVGYNLKGQVVNMEIPAISSLYNGNGNRNGGSAFYYNYNAAFLPLFNQTEAVSALLVRVQSLQNISNPYSVGPSKIAIAYQLRSSSSSSLSLSSSSSSSSLFGSSIFNSSQIIYGFIEKDQVVLEPSGPEDELGTEDPRVTFDVKSQSYYLFYTAVEQEEDGTVSANLALATATMNDPLTWKKRGYVFPQLSWSKSGALLIRDAPQPSLLFFGDSTLVPGIQVATSYNLIDYIYNASVWLPVRPNQFDSVLVEAGPQPLRLSDGNYLFLYNSARQNGPSSKPGWTLQYNIGWVILDGQNPVSIIQRSDQPLLSPTLPWEIGVLPNNLALTPNVVFVEGWQRFPDDPSLDHFILYLGAADSVVGVAEILVQVPTFSHQSYQIHVNH
jgi:predicted GH43/DUF377 family glycosyl hydrolase